MQEVNSNKSFVSKDSTTQTPVISGNIFTEMFNNSFSGPNPLQDLLYAAILVQNNELNIQNSASGMLEIMSQDAATATANGQKQLQTAANAVETAAASKDNNQVQEASDAYNVMSTFTQQSNTDDSNVINGQSTLLSNLSQTGAQATIPTSAVTDAMSSLLSLLASVG